MKVTYQYNGKDLDIDLPENTQVITPNKVQAADASQEISSALSHPIGCESLESFLKGRERILVIVNDGTRPTPTASVLETIEPLLRGHKVSLLIATGCHRGARDKEIRRILGTTYAAYSGCITSHDSRDESSLVYLGESRNGTVLKVNKAVVENDAILIIGSVEPHYFAGYTGGRKAIMPGVAGYISIQMNHKLALRPEAKALNLDDNPVHQDMVDVLSLLKGKSIFSIQTVMDSEHKVYKVYAGDIIKSFNVAVSAADEVFAVNIAHKADIVISIAKAPMDLDLYQSQKAIDNAKLALKTGGILILVAACLDGTGEKSFYDLLSSSDSPQQVLENIEREYKLGYHKAGKMAEVMKWADIYCVSELDKDIWEKIFITRFSSLEEAVKQARTVKGKDASILVLTDGCVTVPKIG
ncbi:MAG: nickel-dependent lactate racemase [Spirochaetia bacterium]|jgi:nickel-dependent lactate racemase|nr:nickel-dependent lactate racemase [Spirochaetia bacterium]